MDSTSLEQFEGAVLPHLDSAYNLARYLTRDLHDAEDVVQEASSSTRCEPPTCCERRLRRCLRATQDVEPQRTRTAASRWLAAARTSSRPISTP